MTIITFSGVDGAGKTTVIQEIEKFLHIKGGKIIMMRHRPSILPILSSIKYGRNKASFKTTEVLPRSGNNTSQFWSLIRFAYYLIDFILGQYVLRLKYRQSKTILLYDRYYFDFICDSKRSNIVLPKKFIQIFYQFIFKPDLNFFLYAPAEVILVRKKELTKDVIEELNSSYLKLFQELNEKFPEQYFPIQNISLESTLTEIKYLLQKIVYEKLD